MALTTMNLLMNFLLQNHPRSIDLSPTSLPKIFSLLSRKIPNQNLNQNLNSLPLVLARRSNLHEKYDKTLLPAYMRLLTLLRPMSSTSLSPILPSDRLLTAPMRISGGKQ